MQNRLLSIILILKILNYKTLKILDFENEYFKKIFILYKIIIEKTVMLI